MKIFVVAAAILVASLVPAAAQRVPVDTNPTADELRNIITFQVDNDFFNPIGRTDRDYTNGLRLGWLSPALPDLPGGLAALTNFPTFFGEDPVTSVTRRLGVSIGQNLYTPQNTDASAPIPNASPFSTTACALPLPTYCARRSSMSATAGTSSGPSTSRSATDHIRPISSRMIRMTTMRPVPPLG